MEQLVDLQVEGNPDSVTDVMAYLNVDRTQRSSNNQNNLFDVFAKSTDENSLCSGYTDSDFDSRLDDMYAEGKNPNNIYFKSFRKNLFKFAAFLSEKFPTCRFKISWLEQFEGDQNLFVALYEKACCLYYQRGKYMGIAPNHEQFIRENGLEGWVELHTRKEREKTE